MTLKGGYHTGDKLVGWLAMKKRGGTQARVETHTKVFLRLKGLTLQMHTFPSHPPRKARLRRDGVLESSSKTTQIN